MSKTLSAERLAQRALDVDILSEADLQTIWSEFGTRNVEPEPFKQALVRRGLLTNYQLDRLTDGLRTGFFYGDYKVLYGVGAGTFARVFRAEHRRTGDLYAVKVLRKRYSLEPTETERFRREGELGAKLKHPNIVAIHEVYSKGAVHYIVMDFIEGRNLRDFFRVRGKFSPNDATKIVTGMVTGLNYAFQQGVSHRDLKMSNVILSSSGESMLLDFGLAGLEDAGAEDLNPRTIDYAGLERATNVRKDDNRSDIFFVGAIYYQLLSGRPALVETRERSQRLSKSRFENITPLAEVMPDVPLPLARVVGKALEFDPDRRYQTPAELLADIKLAAKRVAEGKVADEEQHDSPRLEGHNQDGSSRRLMIVESDMKMQNLFRKLFKECGYRVLVTSDPERLFERLYDAGSQIDALLVCTGELGRSAIEAFNRLAREGATTHLPAVLLLGDQQESWGDQAETDAHRRVVTMPVKSKQLRHAMLTAIAAAQRAGEPSEGAKSG